MKRLGSNGWRIFRIGASQDSFGGDIESQSIWLKSLDSSIILISIIMTTLSLEET